MINLVDEISITARDVTGQRNVRVRHLPGETTVGELLDSLAPRFIMPQPGSDRIPLTARLDREGRTLARSEFVRDALKPDDSLTLLPEVQAGAK